MIAGLLVAQLTIIASGPALPPAEAAATLRRASPDREVRALYPLGTLPVVINVTWPAERAPESWIDRYGRAAARLRRSEYRDRRHDRPRSDERRHRTR